MNTSQTSIPDFQILFEATTGLYLILDPELRIAAVNDAYCRATMTERDRILGRGIFDVFPDNPDDPTADGVSNLRLSLKRVLQFRQSDAMPVQRYDIRRPDSEGGGFEERYWSPLNSPVLDSAHRVRWIIHRVEDVTQLVRLQAEGVARDQLAREQQRIIEQLRDTNEELARQISENTRIEGERQQANDALTRSESRFRGLANNLPGAVYRRIMSPDGQFRDVYISAGIKNLLGVEPGDIVNSGGCLLEHTHPEDRGRQIKALQDSAARLEPLVIEVRKIARPGGNVRTWQIHAMPAHLENGDIQWDCLSLDITESKAAEAQLQQAQKMEAVGQLTGGIAHDFNNLLAIIIGNLDLVIENGQLNPNLQAMMHDALKASLQGADLTRQLLAFSRRQMLQPKVFSINDAVAGTTELLRRTLGERVEIRMHLATDVAPVLADRTQVESALANLAINARDAMPDGGCLTIETANKYLDELYQLQNPEVKPGDYVMLAVSDTGTGIAPEILDRVFEPFFTTKSEGRGSGLGLSMVYGFAKQSQGYVKIYSEVGHGTTIRLFLPRALVEFELPAEINDAPELAPQAATILVVEDNNYVRNIAILQLADLGYQVIQAESAKAALAILRENEHIDVLFTDVIMPGNMTGDVLAQEARRLRPNLGILFTSGFAEASVQNGNHSPNLEGQNLLSKPYRKQDLARKIRETLHASRGTS